MSKIDVIPISTIKITYVQQLLTIEQQMEKVDYCRKLCKSYLLMIIISEYDANWIEKHTKKNIHDHDQANDNKH